MSTLNKRSIFDDESDQEIDAPSLSKDASPTKKNKMDDLDNSAENVNLKIKKKLTAVQKARMEQNRQKALLIKMEKMNSRMPKFDKKTEEKKRIVRINNTALIDTGCGFFIEETPRLNQNDIDDAKKLVIDPAPLFKEDQNHCIDCDQPFDNSFLLQNFNHSTCDSCRDNEERHRLITKTDARNEYLLKDVDLDKREPPLMFIVRKNPHNSHWGDMKLYLKLQVEKRALELWGTEEALEEALIKKVDQQDTNKKKKFQKRMKELRMSVRSSLYTRATKTHEHEYGEEVYLPDEDEYCMTCITCGHSYTYDKL